MNREIVVYEENGVKIMEIKEAFSFDPTRLFLTSGNLDYYLSDHDLFYSVKKRFKDELGDEYEDAVRIEHVLRFRAEKLHADFIKYRVKSFTYFTCIRCGFRALGLYPDHLCKEEDLL